MGIEVLRTGFRVPESTGDEVTLYREQYADNFRLLTGDRSGVMRGIFPEHTMDAVAEMVLIDAVKPLPTGSRATQLTERFGDTVWSSLEFVKRIGTAYDWENFFPLTRKDIKDTIHNVRSVFLQKAVQDFNAEMDLQIIAALMDPVWEQVTLSTTKAKQQATSSLTADNYIYDDGAEGFTPERINLLNERFIEQEVPVDSMQSYLIIGPKQRTQARNNDMWMSADYVGSHPWTNKSIPQIDGHNLLISNQLRTRTDDAGRTVRQCLCVFPGAAEGWIEENLFTDIQARADKGTTMQLAVAQSYGFVRVDDNLVLVFECVEPDILPEVV